MVFEVLEKALSRLQFRNSAHIVIRVRDRLRTYRHTNESHLRCLNGSISTHIDVSTEMLTKSPLRPNEAQAIIINAQQIGGEVYAELRGRHIPEPYRGLRCDLAWWSYFHSVLLGLERALYPKHYLLYQHPARKLFTVSQEYDTLKQSIRISFWVILREARSGIIHSPCILEPYLFSKILAASGLDSETIAGAVTDSVLQVRDDVQAFGNMERDLGYFVPSDLAIRLFIFKFRDYLLTALQNRLSVTSAVSLLS